MTHTITITHTLKPEFLWDIMTTAVESSYEWFRFRNVKRRPEGHEHYLCITEFDAQEIDEDGEIVSTTHITEAKIVEALQKILQGGKVHQGHMNTIVQACAENDAGNIDADLADCILQVACFDEVRYA